MKSFDWLSFRRLFSLIPKLRDIRNAGSEAIAIITYYETAVIGILFHATSSLIFVTLCFIVLLLFLILSPFLSLYLLLSNFLNLRHPTLCRKSCDLLEAEVIESRKCAKSGVNIASKWRNYRIKFGSSGIISDFSIHSLEVKRDERSSNSREKPIIVWLHGVGSTATLSLVLSGIADQISDEFDVYAMDLPMMGRSVAPDCLRQGTTEDIETSMVEVIRAYIQSISCGQKVYLVGHSGSAYHAVNVSLAYPELIDRLLLIDGGGFFPVWGRWTAYAGVLFKLGMPSYQLRALGRYVLSILTLGGGGGIGGRGGGGG